MLDGELIYLIGVIAAFGIFAVTLMAVTQGQHLPPAGTTQPKRPMHAGSGH